MTWLNDTWVEDDLLLLLGGDNATETPALVADSAYRGFMENSRFLVQRVLVPVVVLVGVLGNVVTMVVLTRRRMRSSTNVYLTALAASDLLYLLFLYSLSLAHYGLHGAMANAYWTYWRFGLWLTDATSCTSIWLTVTFTMERYIAVCHPLRGKMLCTEPRARKVTALVWVFCFLSTASTPFEWKTVLEPTDNSAAEAFNLTATDANFTVPVQEWKVKVLPTDLAMLDSYRTIFYWFTSVMFTLLPLLLLVVFNSFLVFAVHRSQKQRRHMTQCERHQRSGAESTAQQENKITVTLIAVVVLFLVCQSPSAVTLIYSSLSEEPAPQSAKDHIMRGLGNIFNLLVAVNAACNFILYCALSDKYRRTFAMTFLPRRCWARRDRRSNVLGATSHTAVHSGYHPSGDVTPAHRSARTSPSSMFGEDVTGGPDFLHVAPLNGRGGDTQQRLHQSFLPRQGHGGPARGSCTKSLLSRPDDLSKHGSPQSDSPQHRSLLQKCLLRLQPRRRATKPAAQSVPEPRVKITVSEYNSTSDNTGFSSV